MIAGSKYRNLKSCILYFAVIWIIYGACTQVNSTVSPYSFNFTINGDSTQPNLLLGTLSRTDSNLCYKSSIGIPITLLSILGNSLVHWSINGKSYSGQKIQFIPDKPGFYEILMSQNMANKAINKCIYIRPKKIEKQKSVDVVVNQFKEEEVKTIPQTKLNAILQEVKPNIKSHKEYYRVLKGASCKDLALSACNSSITNVERTLSHYSKNNNEHYYTSVDKINKFKNRIACNEAELLEILKSDKEKELTIEFNLMRKPGESCKDATIIKILAVSSDKDVFKK